MNWLEQELKQHPQYLALKEILAKSLLETGAAITEIGINGVPFVLQQQLVSLLTDELECNLMYAHKDSAELRRYVNTLYAYKITELKYSELANTLSNNNFSRVPRIDNQGEYSIKGDVILFWPIGYEHPIRATFFGDDFEEAVLYDEIYGKAEREIASFVIGDIAKLETEAVRNSIGIKAGKGQYVSSFILFNSDDVKVSQQLDFDFDYSRLFFQRFDLLEKELARLDGLDYQIKIFSKHKSELPQSVQKYLASDEYDFDAGFTSPSLKLLTLTDRELFGTVFLSREVSKLSSKRARKLLANLEGEIEIGDYVVHEDHGIGIYKGLKQEELEEQVYLGFGDFKTKVTKEDYILIAYAQEDELYVPLSQIDKITKYIATDSDEPKLTRLSKVEWTRLKQKVKESVEKLARELVEHYAKRELAKAPEVNMEEISQEYQQFVDDFPYHETADQLQVEQEVLKDLQTDVPMNRLIVGDVGFGKTEIAMRAAFAIAASGKQVAVLCPTTILAMQHQKVFEDRFKNTGMEVAALSRLNTPSQNREIVEKLNNGQVDIIIGTHRLLGNDVIFKDLGLIVIDEEQKFGVKQKEKLKKLEYGVHVVSMSATPIPRTLSMALASIQDISLIQTPPLGRKAVKTIVKKMDIENVTDAVVEEVKRGGQIYYVHNRVQTIASKFKKLQKLLPDVEFAYAHGQMSAKEMELAFSQFYEGKVDVLICTTIIENGIDMPNVNTIIIEHAQRFGLGQLYQLRGRVGRGEKQAYAYMFYDGEDIDKKHDDAELPADISETELKKRARRKLYKERLQAIKTASELGAGFNLASKDLEIRGAGNLLGKEQHGNISNIGYGLYMQLLAEEIERLKKLREDTQTS